MRKMIFLLLFLSPQIFAENNYSDSLCGYKLNDITFPLEHYKIFTPEGACLNGKNITREVSDGYEITSSSYNKTGDIFYYTLYKGNGKEGVFDNVLLRAMRYADGKLLISDVLDTETFPEGDGPETDLTGLKVSWYDAKNSTLYVTTEAWATSHAIHAIKFAGNHSLKIVSKKFFTDGDIQFITNKGLSITKISHDDEGAFFPAYLYGRDGKKICQLDTRDVLWAVEQPCLKDGEVLKDRG